MQHRIGCELTDTSNTSLGVPSDSKADRFLLGQGHGWAWLLLSLKASLEQARSQPGAGLNPEWSQSLSKLDLPEAP